MTLDHACARRCSPSCRTSAVISVATARRSRATGRVGKDEGKTSDPKMLEELFASAPEMAGRCADFCALAPTAVSTMAT